MNHSSEPATLAGGIAAALAKLQAQIAPPAEPTVSDHQVIAKLAWLQRRHGFRPLDRYVEPLRAYLAGYALILTGDPGTGKTYLMQCLGIRLYQAESIASYGLRDIARWYEWSDGHRICLDDLGAEPTTVEYGARDEVMRAVIAHRADSQRGQTFVTSNMTAAEIAARYGDRTLSRLLGMGKPFRFTGDNLRSPVCDSHKTGIQP